MPVELAVDGFGERRFTGRIERINPSTEPGTRAILVYVEPAQLATRALRSGMFATGRIALAASAPAPTLPATAVRTEAGQTLRLGDRQRQAVAAHRRCSAGATRPTARRAQDDAAAETCRCSRARFDNLKDGAPALVKAPTSSQNATSTRRSAAPADAPARALAAPERGDTPMWITRTSISNPGLRDDGDDRHHRARPVLVQPAARRADAGRQPAVRDDPDAAIRARRRRPSRRCHQADRVRGQPGVRRQAIRSQLARGLEPGLRRVPAVDQRRAGDPGRARQDRAPCGPAFPKDVKDPLVVRADNENDQPVVSLAVLSPTTGLRELTSLTDQTIVKALENLPGVARIDVNGRVTRQILVQIKPERADRARHRRRPGDQRDPRREPGRAGRPHHARRRATRSCASKARSRIPMQFGRIIVAQQGGGAGLPVAGRRRHRRREGAGLDLARSTAARRSRSTSRRRRTRTSSRPGAACAPRSTSSRTRLPVRRRDAHRLLERRRGRDAASTASSRRSSRAALLTVLIVFLFLHSWRSTIITGLTLPLAVIATFIALVRVRLHAQLPDADGAVAVHRPPDRRRDRRAREHRAPPVDGQGPPDARRARAPTRSASP